MNTKIRISRSVLAAKFTRKSRPTEFTRVISNLNDSFVRDFADGIELREAEQPVLAMVEKPVHWLLLTTDRTVYRREDNVIEFQHSEIKDADFDFRMFIEQPKELVTRIDITTEHGIFHIDVEPGQAHSRLLGIYKFLALRNEVKQI